MGALNVCGGGGGRYVAGLKRSGGGDESEEVKGDGEREGREAWCASQPFGESEPTEALCSEAIRGTECESNRDVAGSSSSRRKYGSSSSTAL
jgi:hypothetical protein